jgi:hypothetical protein
MNSKTAAVACVLLAWSARLGAAATFTVNSTLDAVDAHPGDGVCETAPGNGVCTLRGAVQETNASPGADTVVVPAGTYVLTLAGANEDAAATGDLDIHDDLTITGEGASVTSISGDAPSISFDRAVDVFAPAHVVLRNVSLSGDQEDEGGIDIPIGGAIRNAGDLTIEGCIVHGAASQGGGIETTGTLTVINSTVSGDTDSPNGPGGGS